MIWFSSPHFVVIGSFWKNTHQMVNSADVEVALLDKLQRLYLSSFAQHGILRLLSLIDLLTANNLMIRFDGVMFPPQQNCTIHDIFPSNYPPDCWQGVTQIKLGWTSTSLWLILCGPIH